MIFLVTWQQFVANSDDFTHAHTYVGGRLSHKLMVEHDDDSMRLTTKLTELITNSLETRITGGSKTRVKRERREAKYFKSVSSCRIQRKHHLHETM